MPLLPSGIINSSFYFSPQGLPMTVVKETQREGSSQGDGGIIPLTEGGDAAGRRRKKPR